MQAQKFPIRSILVIDDDPDEYDLVSEAVQDINPAISVTFIDSYEQARQSGPLLFDLILLDINMPKNDGFFWLKSIRESGQKTQPVIMFTNSLSPAHIERAYTEGATLYFSKPETYPGLLQGLKELIQMDWSDPSSITSKYFQPGKYLTFCS
jgi:CheY-like chemotaxis protein